MSAQHREGFTDLSRSTGMIAHALGNVTYPTRNFALAVTLLPAPAADLSRGGKRFRVYSACRHAGRTISSSFEVWRIVSEDSDRTDQSFLLIICTHRIFTKELFRSTRTLRHQLKFGNNVVRGYLKSLVIKTSFVTWDTQMFQQIAKFY